MINIHTPCEGWFSISTFRVNENGEEIHGSRRQPVPPFRNMITDSGLNRMGDNSDWLTWCQVGGGATAPTAGDTSLVSRVAGSNTVLANNITAQSSEPFYISRTKTYRFATGVAAGNLAEVGIGWGSTSNLFSRALILDAMGSPTTITVLSDEVLDVTYQFRQYPPAADWAGDITLRSILHGVVSRAAAVNSAGPNPNLPVWYIGLAGAGAGDTSIGLTSAYTGPIGAVTALSPSGTAMPATSVTAAAYSASSLQREISVFFGNSEGNNLSGIASIRVRLGIGLYQFGFTPSIMKTADDTLTLTFRHSWARKAL